MVFSLDVYSFVQVTKVMTTFIYACTTRVNDCDDLRVTEDTIGKIAVNVEKELFTLFQDTHSKYKSRYRSIMFNLKNPRNQVFFALLR